MGQIVKFTSTDPKKYCSNGSLKAKFVAGKFATDNPKLISLLKNAKGVEMELSEAQKKAIAKAEAEAQAKVEEAEKAKAKAEAKVEEIKNKPTK